MFGYYHQDNCAHYYFDVDDMNVGDIVVGS